MKKRMWIGVFAFLLGGMVEGCVSDQRVAEVEQASRMERAHLENFDDLDFNVYSGQKWEQLGRSHAKDIVVRPSGQCTTMSLA